MADSSERPPIFTGSDRLMLILAFGALSIVLGLHYAVRQGSGKPAPCLVRPAAIESHRIDINRAEWWELQALQGIGEKRSKDIVAARARLGGFKTVSELEDVPGIGPKTLSRLTPYLTVGEPEKADGERR